MLSEELVARLGTAVVSGRSVFLYGPSGTGKTSLACNIPAVYDDFVLIPRSIEVDSQVISVLRPRRPSPGSLFDARRLGPPLDALRPAARGHRR